MYRHFCQCPRWICQHDALTALTIQLQNVILQTSINLTFNLLTLLLFATLNIKFILFLTLSKNLINTRYFAKGIDM